MRTCLRRSVALAAAALVTFGGTACGEDGGGPSDAAPREVPSIAIGDLDRCGDQPSPPGFRCGSIDVPFERSDPSLGEAEIGFAVRERDRADRPSKGTIFAVEGGPGFASTATANAYVKLFAPLLRSRELVLVDLRGTGLSERPDCPDVQAGAGPESITLAECARSLGPRFESYRTAAVADDVDDVRRALGLERITLYGDSYGTFFAQSYAFRHPDSLDALVLDSAYPARGESPWYGSLTRTGVRAMAKACERAKSCMGDAGRRLEKLVDYLRDTRRGVGPLLDALQDATYAVPDAFLAIDRAGAALRHGDSDAWLDAVHHDKPGYGRERSYARSVELIVGCNDYPMLWDREASEEERRAQLEEAIRAQDPKRFAPFTPREIALSAEIGYLECLTWPQPTELYQPPIPDDASPPDVPVLVVSGELDSLTTPYEGRLVTEMFPNAEQFVARNAGHHDALYDARGDAAREIRRFLREQLAAAPAE